MFLAPVPPSHDGLKTILSFKMANFSRGKKAFKISGEKWLKIPIRKGIGGIALGGFLKPLYSPYIFCIIINGYLGL